MPTPPATHRVPFQATSYPAVENIEVPKPVQLIPSTECAIVLVPLPTATHLIPFQTALNPSVENIEVPKPVQVIPSLE